MIRGFRRFALSLTLFLLPWTIILLVPQFRTQLWVTAVTGHVNYYGLPWVKTRRDARFWPQSADALPHVVHPAILARNKMWAKPTDAGSQFLEFARISDRYPREAWIVAMALRHLPSLDGRNEHYLAAPDRGPSTYEMANQYTAEVIQDGLRLCKRGRELEPGNAYFDWQEARILFSARRDGECFQRIFRAANKSIYNDHRRAEILADIQSYAQVFPEERMRILDATPKSPVGRFQGINNLQWRLGQLERMGRHEEAIALGRAVCRVGVMQIESGLYWDNAAQGVTPIQAVWMAGSRRISYPPTVRREKFGNNNIKFNIFLAHRYFAYLERHGRRELLPEARAQLDIVNAFRRETEGYQRDHIFADSKNPRLAFTDIFWGGAGFALVAVGFYGLVWLITFPVRLFVPGSPKVPGLSPRRVIYPQTLAWGTMLVMLGLAGFARFSFMFWEEVEGPLPEQLWMSVMISIYFLGILPLLAAFYTAVGDLKVRPVTVCERRAELSLDQLGVPQSAVLVLDYVWKAFEWSLVGVAVLCLPVSFTYVVLGYQHMPDLFRSVGLDDLEYYSDFLALVPLILAGLWTLFLICQRCVMQPRRMGREVLMFSAKVGGYCGRYAIVFSWLLLIVLGLALPIRVTLEHELEAFIDGEKTRSQVGRWEMPAQMPKSHRPLPKIPPVKVLPPPPGPPPGAPPA